MSDATVLVTPRVLRRCRLYDYDKHAWMNFAGEVTAVPLDTSAAGRARRMSDGLLPDQLEPDSPGIFFPPDRASAPGRGSLIRRENV